MYWLLSPRNGSFFTAFFAGILACLLVSSVVQAVQEYFQFDQAFYQRITARYGERAKRPVQDWQELIQDHLQDDIQVKLNAANYFANRRVRYATDKVHWGQNDYWATPIESLVSQRGDCEDYAILKYASLRAMGVEEDNLRLMYVRATTVNEPHMVLIYIDAEQPMPLVLDNLTDKILPADQRQDLRPVYAFNGQGLWLARAKGMGKPVKNSPGVANWTKLLERIEQGE
ncbi:transglutaminase-like cysteine peptidase [Bowmanella denitrificans]|uniref:Transglutaminase-like cysteine peptidase n=1 Tax=Bowmanella denitrificans TaxID=366582 RepID=A0ABN0WKB5_9ALTE|nr:transglutaminase-like cysteine peptidase [Bowmanella denitrificans]